MSQNIIKKIFLLLMLLSVSFSSLCLGSDQYWISFQLPGPDKPAAPEGPKCLLKIDSNGNIIVPLTVVVPNSRFVNGSNSGIALSQGNPGLLNLWLPGRNQSPSGYALYRAVVSKKTLKLISIHRTAMRIEDHANFQTSKRGQNNFIVGLEFRHNAETYAGRRITATGLGTQQWLLTPFQCIGCSFGISDDGRVAFFQEEVSGSVGNQPRPFFLQHLDPAGQLIGRPVLLDLQFPQTGLDITDLLRGGKRLLLYASTGPSGSGVFVIPLDGKTFRPVGKRIKIPLKQSFNSLVELALTGETNLISIDPRGRFIIESGISGGGIFYIPLDSEGRPGTQKVLVAPTKPGSDGGIDLLKD